MLDTTSTNSKLSSSLGQPVSTTYHLISRNTSPAIPDQLWQGVESARLTIPKQDVQTLLYSMSRCVAALMALLNTEFIVCFLS
ncbi:hypothetical protein TNCV_205381 [Trichonephila clavipes]|nr:hypothetical protein TNCV_205381 [Trichonephila clavipes]